MPQGTNSDGSSTMLDGDIGSQPRTWGGRELKVGGKQFFYFRKGDPPPQFDQDAEGYVGTHKGMLQVLYERGKYVEGWSIRPHTFIRTHVHQHNTHASLSCFSPVCDLVCLLPMPLAHVSPA